MFFFFSQHIKKGAVVIDVGIHSVAGSKKLVGDVKYDEAAQVAGAITPVPGGVGPMTVALLMRNTVDAAKRFAERKKMSFIKLDLQDPVPSDEVISRTVLPKPVTQLADEIGVLPSELIQFGPHKAKGNTTTKLKVCLFCSRLFESVAVTPGSSEGCPERKACCGHWSESDAIRRRQDDDAARIGAGLECSLWKTCFWNASTAISRTHVWNCEHATVCLVFRSHSNTLFFRKAGLLVEDILR